MSCCGFSIQPQAPLTHNMHLCALCSAPWWHFSHTYQFGALGTAEALRMHHAMSPASHQAQGLCEVYHHRIIEWPGLKRTTMLIWFQPPSMCRVANQQPRLPRATSSLALNACRDGASTASLGNLFPVHHCPMPNSSQVLQVGSDRAISGSPKPGMLMARMLE